MKYIVTLNGKKYEVEVERGQATAVYMGESMASAPMQMGAQPMMQQVQQPIMQQPMAAPMASMAAESVSGEKIAAPMPGTILEVCCQSGTTVKAGDVLFILEAMKMENEICASRDGVIAGVHVDKGSTVETGTALCTLS